jgi:SAM-dependent methyltransferase
MAEQEEPAASAAEQWDARYRESERIWSGRPNASLVREVSALPPGRALDLGCGEGADAVWLAGRGWQVTAVDVSAVALERAAGHAAQSGVAERITWERHDLTVSFPDGRFDLVSALFLHSREPMPRERVLRRAAEAVAPGGALLIVGHAGPPPWDTPLRDADLPSAAETLRALDLPPADWEVLRSGEYERSVTTPDGQPASWADAVLMLRRTRPGTSAGG